MVRKGVEYFKLKEKESEREREDKQEWRGFII